LNDPRIYNNLVFNQPLNFVKSRAWYTGFWCEVGAKMKDLLSEILACKLY